MTSHLFSLGSRELADAARDYLRWATRYQLQVLLENHGFAVYDWETDDNLRSAVQANVEDGTTPLGDLEL